MYIEHVPNRNSPPAILLRESYRDGNKVKKRTLANLSALPAKVIEGLKVLLRGGVAVPSAEEAFVIERSLPHGHVAAVLGAARACGAEQWFAAAPAALRSVLMALVVARVVSPASKLAAVSGDPRGGEVIEHQHAAGQMLPRQPLLDVFLGLAQPVERGIDLLEVNLAQLQQPRQRVSRGLLAQHAMGSELRGG